MNNLTKPSHEKKGATQLHSAFPAITDMLLPQSRKRIWVRKKHENIPLLLDDIAYLQAENKIVYAVDRNGYRYMLDKPLSAMENELSPRSFFRANRQYIINVNFIKGFRTIDKVKVQVTLELSPADHIVIISQESSAAFRRWIQVAD